MSDNAQIIERGELRVLSLSWSREAFDNATRFWLESSQQWAPWFFQSMFTKPFEMLQELASRALSQQETLTRSVPRDLPGGSRAPRELEAPGPGAVEALRQLEQERDEARAAHAAAERVLATMRAERDEARRALKAAEAEAQKARTEGAATNKHSKPGPPATRPKPTSGRE